MCVQPHRRVCAHVHKNSDKRPASDRDARTSKPLLLRTNGSHPRLRRHTGGLALPARGRAAYFAECMQCARACTIHIGQRALLVGSEEHAALCGLMMQNTAAQAKQARRRASTPKQAAAGAWALVGRGVAEEKGKEVEVRDDQHEAGKRERKKGERVQPQTQLPDRHALSPSSFPS
eukprot:Tamp_18651.p1 GENE.Tamp_18651~~Tamp_18651.p1  ORF type:complete len:176 (+),score=16.31 Tamp_18651:730-1257(+)